MSRERPETFREIANTYVLQEEESLRNRRFWLLYSASGTIGLGVIIAAQDHVYVSAYIEFIQEVLSKVGRDFTREQVVSLLKLGIPLGALRTGISAFGVYRQTKKVANLHSSYIKIEKQQS